MESQPQNPEFRNNLENFHSCCIYPKTSETHQNLDMNEVLFKLFYKYDLSSSSNLLIQFPMIT